MFKHLLLIGPQGVVKHHFHQILICTVRVECGDSVQLWTPGNRMSSLRRWRWGLRGYDRKGRKCVCVCVLLYTVPYQGCFSCVLIFLNVCYLDMHIKTWFIGKAGGRLCPAGWWEGTIKTGVKAKCWHLFLLRSTPWWVMVSFLWLCSQSLSTPPPLSISRLFAHLSFFFFFFLVPAVCAYTVLGI